jgi:hypothetical protein
MQPLEREDKFKNGKNDLFDSILCAASADTILAFIYGFFTLSLSLSVLIIFQTLFSKQQKIDDKISSLPRIISNENW